MEQEKTFSYTVEQTLTEEDMLDVLTTAFEGGIGYWACLDNGHPDWIEARKQWKEANKTEEDPDPQPCYCDTALQVLKNGKAIILYDEEDDDKELHLTLENLLKGCQIYATKRGKSVQKMLDEGEFDACDADCIVQYAIFGEIVYA